MAQTNPPYRLVWSNVSEGSYTLLAVARDRYGPVVTSTPPVGIIVASTTTNLPVFSWSNVVCQVAESAGSVTLHVLKNANSVAATVNYATLNGSATANSSAPDYGAAQGQLSFAAGELVRPLTLPIYEDTLSESNQFFTVTLSLPSSGTLAGPDTATVWILDNDEQSTNSLTQIVPPPLPPSPLGSLRVNLQPAAALGQWRFTWEFDWRDGGGAARGLPAGNYEIEFKPLGNYTQPAPTVVPVLAGLTNEFTFVYTNTALPQLGSLTLTLEPALLATNTDVNQRAQWRRQGETTWHDSGESLHELPAGTYVVQFKSVAGWATPASRLMSVVANQNNLLAAQYYVVNPEPGNEPRALDFSEVNLSYAARLPYAVCGQLLSDLGWGSGAVVKERLVLTAAHVVFDDRALTYLPASGVKWFFQRHAGDFEPAPQTPRGWCVLAGYAAQRQADGTPGLASVASQNLDVAALYFLESAGRGGLPGRLGPDGGAGH